MVVRLFLTAATFALATAAQAQTPPLNPALPSIPSAAGLAPSGATGPGVRHRRPPARQDLQPSQQGRAGADTRRIQSETDELYREIMRRSAAPTGR